MILLLPGCLGTDADTSTTGETCDCGDPDGAGGTDTGNVPDVFGSWSSAWGGGYYDDDCSAGDFDSASEDWIGAFYVVGTAPSDLYMYFGPEGEPETERFYGAFDAYGGISFSGRYDHSAGTLHAQFGGLVYADANQSNRTVIRGAGFLGLDADEDGDIDCNGNGSWTAIKND